MNELNIPDFGVQYAEQRMDFPRYGTLPGEPPTTLYKVIVRGDTADNAIDNLFSDDMFFRQQRVSPIVVYIQLSDNDAIELAQRPDFEVTRARADWSI